MFYSLDSTSGFIVTTLLALVCYYIWKTFQNRPQNFPPGPNGLPILGNLEINERDADKFTAFSKIYGPLFSLRFLKIRFIILNDWKVAKEALIGQSEIFSGRPNSFVINQVSKKNDIVTLDGPLWKEKRRMTVQFLRNLGFGKTSMEMVISDEVSKFFDILDTKKEKPVEMKNLLFMPILNVLWSVVTGNTYRYDDPEMNKIVDLIQDHFQTLPNALPLSGCPILRFLPGDIFQFKKLIRISKEIHNYLEKEIEVHRVTFKAENEPRNFIDAYLAEIFKKKDTMAKGNHPYQIKHLVGTVLDMLMAGIETSKTTLEWGFLYMAKWPNIQKKVQNELETIIGRSRLPNYSDITQLPYTEATILEIHRYASILPLSLPHRVTTNTKLAGYDIPKNTLCFPNIRAIHNEKELWGDPEVFRPERFITSDGKVEKPEYLIPFLIGARACIGASLARMELFLFFSSILHRYSFSFVSGETPPSITFPKVKSLTVGPDPYHLHITDRY